MYIINRLAWHYCVAIMFLLMSENPYFNVTETGCQIQIACGTSDVYQLTRIINWYAVFRFSLLKCTLCMQMIRCIVVQTLYLFVLHIPPSHCHHYAKLSESFEHDEMSSVWLKLSELSFMQYMGLCVISLLIKLLMIVRKLYLLSNI